MRCPRTLGVLWTEYEFGIGGSKPAELFTARKGQIFLFFKELILKASRENDSLWIFPHNSH